MRSEEWLVDRRYNNGTRLRRVTLQGMTTTQMRDEDSDFDEYNDVGFDEAFADLIESLRDAENGTNISCRHL